MWRYPPPAESFPTAALPSLCRKRGEWDNLYDDPARQGIVRELKGALLDWMISADENDQIARKWLI